MGFPSPAQDYVEQRLTPEILCGVNANTLIVETCDGYALVEKDRMPGQGDIALISCGESERFARLSGRTFIIDDGEILQDEALDDVIVVGVVTHIITAFEVSDVPF